MNDSSRSPASTVMSTVRASWPHLKLTSAYFIEKIATNAFSIVTYIVIARTYGPTLLGTYSYAQAVMQFAVPFLAAGCEGILIRELVRGTRPQGQIVGSAFALLCMTGLVATLIPFAFIVGLHPGDGTLLQISFFLGLAFLPNAFLVVEQVLKAERNPKPVVLSRIASVAVSMSAKLLLIYLGYPIETIAIVTAGEAVLLSCFLLCAYYRTGHSARAWAVNIQYAIFFAKQSLPVMIAAITLLLFFRVNHILLVQLAGFEVVGQYAAAFQVMQLFLIIPYVVFVGIYPRMVFLYSNNPARFRFIMDLCYLGFALLGYAIIIFNFLFSKLVFGLLFGTRYLPASEIIIVLSVGNLFIYMSTVRGWFVDLNNTTHYHVVYSAIGLAILVPCSILAIPRYGAIGASWSLTLATFVSGILTSFLFASTRAAGLAQLRALAVWPAVASLRGG